MQGSNSARYIHPLLMPLDRGVSMIKYQCVSTLVKYVCGNCSQYFLFAAIQSIFLLRFIFIVFIFYQLTASP